jgi:hypothetical protein
MLMTATTELIRALRVLARAADAGLVERATHNAATVVADRQARQLENARTMRDLRRLEDRREQAQRG